MFKDEASLCCPGICKSKGERVDMQTLIKALRQQMEYGALDWSACFGACILCLASFLACHPTCMGCSGSERKQPWPTESSDIY